MRLINADKLKYKNLAEVNGKLTYVLTAEEIDNAPTVELNDKSLEIAKKSIEIGRRVGKLEGKLERPQGKWITTRTMIHDGNPYCSICDEENIIRSKFCPNCGADMRGEEKNDEC